MHILRLSSVRSKFSKFLMSFFNAQVSSSSNFATFFTAMTHNSYVLFFGLNIIFFRQKQHIKVNFPDLLLLALKLTKFLESFLEPRVSFSSNFASLFSGMRYNFSGLFYLKIYILSTKGAHQSANF